MTDAGPIDHQATKKRIRLHSVPSPLEGEGQDGGYRKTDARVRAQKEGDPQITQMVLRVPQELAPHHEENKRPHPEVAAKPPLKDVTSVDDSSSPARVARGKKTWMPGARPGMTTKKDGSGRDDKDAKRSELPIAWSPDHG